MMTMGTVARRKTLRAMASGQLEKGPCEKCGRAHVVAHHDDYAEPLRVRWLCDVHHSAWHHKHGPGANRDTEIMKPPRIITRKKKPRRGRPPGPPENVRRCLVVLRLNPDEHARIASAAEASGEAIAEWMRNVCVDVATMRLCGKRMP